VGNAKTSNREAFSSLLPLSKEPVEIKINHPEEKGRTGKKKN